MRKKTIPESLHSCKRRMVLFDLHSPQPTDDSERRSRHEQRRGRQLKTKERCHTDEAEEQRRLEELIVEALWKLPKEKSDDIR